MHGINNEAYENRSKMKFQAGAGNENWDTRYSTMTGWWYTYPSEKYESVGIMIIPNMMGKIIQMFQTLNQMMSSNHDWNLPETPGGLARLGWCLLAWLWCLRTWWCRCSWWCLCSWRCLCTRWCLCTRSACVALSQYLVQLDNIQKQQHCHPHFWFQLLVCAKRTNIRNYSDEVTFSALPVNPQCLYNHVHQFQWFFSP